MTKKQNTEQEEWRLKLLNILKPGDTIDCVLRHVSRSGMSRRIDLYARTADGPMFITGMAAAAMGNRWDRDKGGIIVGGCGMDMGFHLVYNLAWILWPQGFDCIGEAPKGQHWKRGCPSNDHSNGDRNYSPDHPHKDGGYALHHNWL